MKHLHLWFSLPLGLVMSITCFTGAVLIFEPEITESIQSHYYHVEPLGREPLSIEELMANVEPELEEGQRITGVVISNDAERSYKVNLSQPKRAAIYVDQYSGEVLGQPERLEFFKVMFRLHRWLMDERPEDENAVFWGKLIVGISTLVMVLILLTGIVLWWPKGIKALKNRTTIALRKGWRRFWYDLHVVGGVYAVLLLLVMALTGLTWSFEWYNKGLYKLLGVDIEASSPEGGASRGSMHERAASSIVSPYAMWDEAYDAVAAERGDCSSITVSSGVVSVSLDAVGNQRAADKYHFSTLTGEIESVERYVDSSERGKIRGWIYSLHVGNWGGMATRVLWFLAALLGASFPLTGYYLWIKRMVAKRKA